MIPPLDIVLDRNLLGVQVRLVVVLGVQDGLLVVRVVQRPLQPPKGPWRRQEGSH